MRVPRPQDAFARCAALLAAAVFSVSPRAQETSFHLYDQSAGLDFGEVVALAQDDTGFLWLGTHRGLVRFDGNNFVAWGRPRLDELVDQLAYGPGDELIAVTFDRKAWRRTGGRLEALAGPGAKQATGIDSLAFDAAGTLWVVIDGSLWRRDGASKWQPVVTGISSDEPLRTVRCIGASIIVLTDKAVWRVRNHAPPERVLAEPGVAFVDGTESSLWLARQRGGGLWRVDAGGVHRMDSPTSRLIDLRVRNDTLWLAYDTELIAIDARGRRRTLSAADGLPSGGPLLVDHERSLWLGTFVGLVQFPEPDTWRWTVRSAIPSGR